jgi:hypothetical protein
MWVSCILYRYNKFNNIDRGDISFYNLPSITSYMSIFGVSVNIHRVGSRRNVI